MTTIKDMLGIIKEGIEEIYCNGNNKLIAKRKDDKNGR